MSKVSKEAVESALKNVHDPEIPVNVYDLGLIYDIQVEDEGVVHITMTLTNPNCPVADKMPAEVAQAVKEVEGVSDARVKLVFEPQWTKDRMSEAAMLELGLF